MIMNNKVLLIVVAVVLVLGIAWAVFGNRKDTNMESVQNDTQTGQENDGGNEPVNPSVSGGQLQITTITPGSGQAVKTGDTISVFYTGTFENGQTFDSNVGKSPFSFTVGAGGVIEGWEQGVVGMQVGEKRKLVIPPSLGYGPMDYGPIPGNSTLIFEVELVQIQ